MRRYQTIILSATFLVVCIFSYRLFNDLFSFYSHSVLVPARVIKWEIQEIQEKYAIQAEYEYEIDKNKLKGVFLFSKPYYLNEFAAISSLKVLAKKDWNAWIQPKSPQRSILEKSFPANLLFRSLICYSVFVYLLFLNFKFNKNRID